MATTEAIAIRKDQAQARIDAAALKLARALTVSTKELDLAPTHKDPAIRVAVHLEAIADFLETAVASLPGTLKKAGQDAVDAYLAEAEAKKKADELPKGSA